MMTSAQLGSVNKTQENFFGHWSRLNSLPARICHWPDFVGEAEWTENSVSVYLKGPEGSFHWTSADPLALIVAAELHSTTEQQTLAALYEEPREQLADALAQFTGSFALALLQPATQSLLLATDHFGIRPVYYWQSGARVVFATRLSLVARLVPTPLSIDRTSVYHYLNFTYVPGPHTIYREIAVLPPGTALHCTRGSVKCSSYWQMQYPADALTSEEELAYHLRREIERAVLQAVPADGTAETIGAFLSGGTDSGTIAGVVSHALSPLRAYSIAFSEDDYNELQYAKLLADRFGLDHRVHHLTADELLESIPLLVDASDQPFGNPSIVATWRCAKLAAETDVHLLLAGDGGDEIFGGNERYAKDYLYSLYHRLPAWARRLLLNCTTVLPGNSLLCNRLHNFAYRGNLPNPERFYADDAFASKLWPTLMRAEVRQQINRHASLAVVQRHYQHAGAEYELDRLLYIDLQMAIWGNDIPKVMTAARAAGVRVRFPFLDPALASFTGTLPPHYKVRGLEKRYLFKRAVAGLLPQETLQKTKHGFGVPVSEWVRTNPRVQAAVLEPILDPHSFVREYLTNTGIQRIVDDHLRGDWDYGMWLWALMMLERWLRVQRDGTHDV